MALAFVLDSDELAGSDGFTFPGFPGVWTLGEPVEAAPFVEMGVFASEEEMQARITDLGLPLTATDVPQGSAPLPARSNHIEGDTEADKPVEPEAAEAAPDQGSEGDTEADKPVDSMTSDELDAKAEELAVDPWDKSAKVADKKAALNAWVEAHPAGES